MKKVIGLTGGIGAGKSTVSEILAEQGAYIIDCDKISHEVTGKDGVAIKELAASFEGVVKDGVLDRAALSRIVFGDDKKRHLLNAVTHKYIMREVDERLARAEGIAVIDAPLLFEAGADSRCNVVFFVDAPEQLRLSRIMKRDGLSREDAILRIKAQDTAANKKRADVIIDNSGDREATKRQILEKISEIGEKGI